jgi:hypothetical protein
MSTFWPSRGRSVVRPLGGPALALIALAPLIAAPEARAREPRRHLPRAAQPPFQIHDVEVGDPLASYANVELTAEGNFLVWFEQTTDGSGRGTVWHCLVDAATGELIPSDGRGFRAFDSYAWARANPGRDARGPYYIGADRLGRLVLVRPTGAEEGDVEVVGAVVDPLRRAIYPADLPDRVSGLVLWIENEEVPGAGYDRHGRNTWFELRYLDLADPTREHVIERQARPAVGFAPMDFGFARWVRSAPALTYGASDALGRVQVREFTPQSAQARDVTDDPHSHVDPFPFVFKELEVLIPGIDGTASSIAYTRAVGQRWFVPTESIAPPASTLSNPSLAQSHEGIVLDGQAFTFYQINEAGSGFFDTAFANPGEIWLSTLFTLPQRQWRLSAALGLAVAEPEPFAGDERIWVFYSATAPGQSIPTARWSLRRCDTPLRAGMPPPPPPSGATAQP